MSIPKVGGIKVAFAVPCHDTTPSMFTYDLAQAVGATLLVIGRGDSPIQGFGLFFLSGTYIPVARQELAEEALAQGYTHILWLDSDMRFPSDILFRLLRHNKEIVGINYSSRKIPPRFTAIKQVGREGAEPQLCMTMPDSRGLEDVEALGFGALLMRTSVFQRLHDPAGERGHWFQTRWDEALGQNIGEDVYFCELARKVGAMIFVDHDLSKDCAHIGSVEYTLEHAQDHFMLEEAMVDG